MINLEELEVKLEQESSDEEYLPHKPTDYQDMLSKKDRILK